MIHRLDPRSAGQHDRIQQIIESLKKADSEEVVRDRRLSNRRPFVRPVLVALGRDRAEEIQTVSNNLSQTGIGLVHDVEMRVGRIGVLTILRLHDEPVRIRAAVRWCQPFCGVWFASGWQFLIEEPN